MFNDRARPPRIPAAAAVLAAALLGVLPAAVFATSDALRAADKVLVVKSEHRLYLLRDGQPYRSYKVALGLNPVGHKERAGDFRTPEGNYRLDGRNPSSDFFLAIHLSYPSPDDVARAKRHHWQPGGSIMIHGLPNVPRRSVDYYRSTDWTDGCIALTNDDMLEVWLLTRENTPIEIRP
ncbi:MAG TPA: L,D-transpeptidase family protein [Steroidobacteraceae bacterium]|nr:L,D-transpeptidase family protein [Steroidobacteraceae bacterium]